MPGHEYVMETLRQAEETADLPYLHQQMPQAFERIFDGMERVTSIVRAMKEFGHPDQRAMSPADLNKALTTTLTVMRNEYKYIAEVETDFGDLPPVLCHLGDINQVFLSLIINAAHAIADAPRHKGEKGRIWIRTEHQDDAVLITIRVRWTPSVGQHWGNVISEGPAVFPRYTNALLAGHLLSFDCSSDCTESPLNTSAGVR